MDYDLAVRSVLTWAMQNDNVRAVVLTGSAATQAQHPLSDRDLELYVRNAESLENDDSWWLDLGDVLAVERLENGDDQPTRLVYYVGGKLDFTLVNAVEAAGEYDRPFQVLLDKDDLTVSFSLRAHEPNLPDQGQFDECCNWASAAALMAAKAIVREEPWSVITRDADLKSELLRMIEWDHNIRYGTTRDVRYLGTRMRQWMDQDIQARLVGCWAMFGDDSGQALTATLELFQELADRIARATNLGGFHHAAVRKEVDRILNANRDVAD
ncbi:aminoglycoside 6-adenylyltransferase [Rhodococcus sp. 14-2483-1-2]|uniref:aminoglycoside 6-adenylyltransferase n=1 Tax=Rhodococcus sp. 14-2483-1-2 TaxID=2023147 RepID=UPI002585C692|nr:aminoglycoside 6-adenylyltransferase [Rhodococcus sp. 14-2483-1-2]